MEVPKEVRRKDLQIVAEVYKNECYPITGIGWENEHFCIGDTDLFLRPARR
jgi:hypothetical protein